MVRAAVATSILSAIALTAGAQTTVNGRVVADDTGDPIPNARVTVAFIALGTPVVLSDGDVSFDALDRSKTPARSDIALSPIPVDFDLSPSNIAIADIHADWSFEIAGVNGPRRLQLLRRPAGWALKAIHVGGFDVTDRPLPFGRKEQSLNDVEVVLTDRINALSGTIPDGARPAPGANVVVFSTDRDRWYPSSRFLRTAVAGANGEFTIAGLPFGSYYAAAVAQLPVEGEDAWQSSEFLTSLLPRASTVTVGVGQNPSISLRLPGR